MNFKETVRVVREYAENNGTESVRLAYEDYHSTLSGLRIITVIEIFICVIILLLKFFVL